MVQETVICVTKDIQKFQRDRARGSFKGWLRNLTRWRIQDQLRKRLPAPGETAESTEEGAGALDAEPLVEAESPAPRRCRGFPCFQVQAG